MIKTTIQSKEEKKKETSYPWIGIADKGTIVLFISKETGYELSNIDYRPWHYSNTWVEKIFTPFTGTITLENE